MRASHSRVCSVLKRLWVTLFVAAFVVSAVCSVNVTATFAEDSDTTPPTVSITSPTTGAQVGRTVSIAANASDADSGIDRVEFRVNGRLVGSDSVAPFAASWIPTSPDATGPVVSFTFDDGNRTQYTDYAPLLAAEGWPATVYVNTDDIATGVTTKVTLAELDELRDRGWEISSHTADHWAALPPSPTESDYEASIGRAKAWLDANGFPDSGFASANGLDNATVKPVVQRYHPYNRVSWGVETLPVADPYTLHVGYSFDYATDVAGFRAVLDQAVAERSWVIMLGHGWTPPGDFFPAMIDEIKARGMRVATVRDVIGGPYTIETTAYDRAGHSSIATCTVTTDRTPPSVSDVRVTNVGSRSATIEWTSNEPAAGLVEYGLTAGYGSATPTETVLSTDHSVTLTGLSPETTYQYRVSSADDLGNLARSTGAPFTTTPASTYTLTYTAGPGGTISGTTPQTVDHGGSGTAVTAQPNTGYHFVSWSDGVTTATRTETNVTADKSVTATFAINTYTLTYTAGAHGTISGTSPQTVNWGALGSQVTAVADTGYHFVSWSDGVLTAARTDAGAANLSVTATFAINTYTLTYTAGPGGTISGTSLQAVNHGGSGTAVTAQPNTGYHFVSWSDGVTTATRTETNVTADKSVSATFAINTYTLTYTAGAGGTISGTTPQTVNHGAGGTAVTAQPNTGYHFVSWSDGVTTATRAETNVTADKSVTATFAINTYTLTYTAGTGGTISGTTPQTVNHAGSGTAVTARPNTGYHFVSWSDGVTTATRAETNVTADKSVTATFAINTYTLTYTAGPGGSVEGSATQTVAHGYSGTSVTATPSTGYHFVRWSDGGTSATRTDTNVAADKRVDATFEIDTAVSLSAPSSCSYGYTTLSASLSTTGGVPVPGKTLRLQSSPNNANWSTLKSFPSGTSAVAISAAPTAVTYYRIAFSGDATYTASTSRVVKTTPRVYLTSARASRISYRRYRLYGSIKPAHSSSRAVVIYRWRDVSGKWKPEGYTYCPATSYTYSLRYAFPSTGKWRIQVVHLADSHNARTMSGYTVFYVR